MEFGGGALVQSEYIVQKKFFSAVEKFHLNPQELPLYKSYTSVADDERLFEKGFRDYASRKVPAPLNFVCLSSREVFAGSAIEFMRYD